METHHYRITICRDTQAQEILVQQDIPAEKDEQAIAHALTQLALIKQKDNASSRRIVTVTKIIYQETLD